MKSSLISNDYFMDWSKKIRGNWEKSLENQRNSKKIEKNWRKMLKIKENGEKIQRKLRKIS